MESGIMEDRDWLAPGQDYLTNFSSHANYTGNMIMMDAGAGVSFPLFSLFLVKPYLGFSYQYFKWTARDGYIQYPKGPDGTYLDNAPWNESLEKDPFYGPVASYAQNWFVFAPGLSLGLSLFRYLFLEFHFSLGPVLSCITMDDHFNARHENQDYLSGGIFMEPGGKIVFSPNKKIEIALFAAYRFVSGSRGSSYTRFTGVEGAYRVSGTFTENGYEGGAGFSFLDGGISLKIRF
jgi:outer membrane protease